MNTFFIDDDAETYIIDVDDDDAVDDDNTLDISCQIENELMRYECGRKIFNFIYNDVPLSGIPIKRIDKNNVIFSINGKLKKIKMELANFK